MLEHIKVIMQEIIKKEFKAGDAGGGAFIDYRLGAVEEFGGYKYVGNVEEVKTLADGTTIIKELEDTITISVEFDPE